MMRSNFKLVPLLCLFFFAALGSASLLFKPSTSRHTEKRALLDTHNAGGLTNAKRLAAGLPPLPPRTRTDTAKRSAVSLTSISGKIQVCDSDGNILGYATLSTGIISVKNIAWADTFSLAIVPGVVNSQINIRDSTAPDDAPYLAALVPFPEYELVPNSVAPAYLGLSPATPAGSTPQDDGLGSISGGYESAIWTYDPSNGNIGVQWVNHDGSTYPTTIMYSSGNVDLYLIGDPELMKTYAVTPQLVVTFRLV